MPAISVSTSPDSPPGVSLRSWLRCWRRVIFSRRFSWRASSFCRFLNPDDDRLAIDCPRYPRGWTPSDRADVRRGRTLLALDHLELDLLALREAAEALHGDRRVVHEDVLRAILRRDETKALGVVEPLDRTF